MTLEQKREYQRRWGRSARRRNSPSAERQRAAVRLYRKSTGAQKVREYRKKWLLKPGNAERYREAYLRCQRRAAPRRRRQYMNSRRCFFCLKYKRWGRPKKVERMVLTEGGWKALHVLWCGNC